MAGVVDFVNSLICASHVLFFIAVATTAALIAITPGTGAEGGGIVVLAFLSMITLFGIITFGNSLIRHVPSMFKAVSISAIAGMFISLPIFLVITMAITHTAFNTLFPGVTLVQAILGSIAYAAFTGGLTLYAIIAYTCYKHRCSTWELINKHG